MVQMKEFILFPTGVVLKSDCYAVIGGRVSNSSDVYDNENAAAEHHRDRRGGDSGEQAFRRRCLWKRPIHIENLSVAEVIFEQRGPWTKFGLVNFFDFENKAPTWLTKFAPADALVMQEEAWNAYPRCKSVVKCPYFTRFILTIDTIHLDDNGQSENVHGLTKEQLAVRQVEMIDIASAISDYWSYIIGSSNIDLSQFQSARTGRGPLMDGWQGQCDPVSTAYKLVTIDAPYWGFGGRLEQALVAGERALFLESHRNCFGWIDEWFGLSMEEMRELEKQSDSSLNQKLGRPCVIQDNEDLDEIRTIPSC